MTMPRSAINTTTHLARLASQSRQRGAAVIELAIVSMVMMLMVTGMIEFGRVFWYADALSKATRAAARHMSLAPRATLYSVSVAEARQLAVDIALAANVSGSLSSEDVEVSCLNSSFSSVGCADGIRPENVRVQINGYSIEVGGLMPFMGETAARMGVIQLSPSTTMRYMPS
ncbi:pilus assembly protein [Pseudomethylobacillus aquaticus]|uniref:Pilus assembly protein n=1 Tax=Pseudomethylobacillus aquaticus TaxID=2676064 RepID=A0A3N0UYE5_9PROT|nr:TadE family protein [Pseudomethylobacillus aquaticus]ROH85402.1 pilus assembly protein [Pseudomethylobacillus aquaticus]